MGGGLMQLVAYGAQDIYLTGNPQITFFKVVYRRHTNFSMETIEQTVNGSSITGDSKSATVTISRNGDLVHKVYVNVSQPKGESGDDLTPVDDATPALSSLKEVELEIGGQRIDRHSLEWLATWFELSVPAGRAYELSTMMGDSGYGTGEVLGTAGRVEEAQIPLQFWFCRNPGLALPLIALQYHEVKLKFQFAGTTSSQFGVLCDYIYLDTDERRRFAQVSHEYLIEQVQQQSETGSVTAVGADNIRLNFNHPVKELIWTMGNTSSGMIPKMGGDSTTSTSKFTSNLQLNGHDRFSERSQEYFGLRQPYDYHSAVPGPNLPLRKEGVYTTNSTRSGNVTDSMTAPAFVYSFALKPEEHQPSGTCNFSRIDNAKLIVRHGVAPTYGTEADGTTGAVNYNIFAVNYKVLRIMSGMGGLAYSN